MQFSPSPLSLKKLLTVNKNWYRYEQHHLETNKPIRETVLRSVSQILSCKHYSRGHAQYHCSNSTCTHEKRVPFTCKNRMCNSCGKLASDKWVAKQLETLPRTEWQHITVTMPSELWPFFELNRHLLNDLPRIASRVILRLAKKMGVKPGIFTALHTFGRDLKWNTHVHLSVTRGGLTNDNQWKSVFFKAKSIMAMWRYGVIKLLRKQRYKGLLKHPSTIKLPYLDSFISQQYGKHWHIHCAKPQKDAEKDIAYLGRYIKRPPLANSRLVHYSGNDVLFKYHDHHTNRSKQLRVSVFVFLNKFTQHIPEKHFKMIRYYGFLANRVRKKLLPLVNALTETVEEEKTSPHISWRTLYRKTFGANPLQCILCQSQLRLSSIIIGLSSLQLQLQRPKLALQKIIRV